MYEWDLKSFEWDLRPESVVVEVGAFHGRWALEIMQRYNPHLYMFEPQDWLIPELQATFRPWNKARILPYGLGIETEVTTLWEVGNDGATFVQHCDARDEGQLCELREIGQAFDELGLARIDLMLINIEGGEFTLIPHMFERGIFPRCLMVQMHIKFGDEWQLREVIQQCYDPLWNYGSVLSAWNLRGA